jgi:hypothetical protein
VSIRGSTESYGRTPHRALPDRLAGLNFQFNFNFNFKSRRVFALKFFRLSRIFFAARFYG